MTFSRGRGTHTYFEETFYILFDILYTYPPHIYYKQKPKTKHIYRDQNWALLPVQATLTVRAGSHCRGSAGFPGFPEWLGKNSTRNKRKRLLSELNFHISEKVTGGPEVSVLYYC